MRVHRRGSSALVNRHRDFASRKSSSEQALITGGKGPASPLGQFRVDTFRAIRNDGSRGRDGQRSSTTSTRNSVSRSRTGSPKTCLSSVLSRRSGSPQLRGRGIAGQGDEQAPGDPGGRDRGRADPSWRRASASCCRVGGQAPDEELPVARTASFATRLRSVADARSSSPASRASTRRLVMRRAPGGSPGRPPPHAVRMKDTAWSAAR